MMRNPPPTPNRPVRNPTTTPEPMALGRQPRQLMPPPGRAQSPPTVVCSRSIRTPAADHHRGETDQDHPRVQQPVDRRAGEGGTRHRRRRTTAGQRHCTWPSPQPRNQRRGRGDADDDQGGRHCGCQWHARRRRPVRGRRGWNPPPPSSPSSIPMTRPSPSAALIPVVPRVLGACPPRPPSGRLPCTGSWSRTSATVRWRGPRLYGRAESSRAHRAGVGERGDGQAGADAPGEQAGFR